MGIGLLSFYCLVKVVWNNFFTTKTDNKNGTVIWVDTHGFKAVEGKLSVEAKLVTAIRVRVSVGRRYFFRYGLGNFPDVTDLWN